MTQATPPPITTPNARSESVRAGDVLRRIRLARTVLEPAGMDADAETTDFRGTQPAMVLFPTLPSLNRHGPVSALPSLLMMPARMPVAEEGQSFFEFPSRHPPSGQQTAQETGRCPQRRSSSARSSALEQTSACFCENTPCCHLPLGQQKYADDREVINVGLGPQRCSSET